VGQEKPHIPPQAAPFAALEGGFGKDLLEYFFGNFLPITLVHFGQIWIWLKKRLLMRL
jgi:hypothetical protein